jgi:hypothetical protein
LCQRSMTKSKCSPASPNGPNMVAGEQNLCGIAVAPLIRIAHVVCPRAFPGQGIVERNFLAVARCRAWNDEMTK